MLSKNLKIGITVLLILIFVFCGYLFIDKSSNQDKNIESSTTGFYRVTNKSALENLHWIEVNDARDNSFRIKVNDDKIWGEIEVGKNYTLHFKKIKNENVLQSIYPELYNGRIE
jgi:hypothetical protein